MRPPRLIVIAGPNGAGKSTFTKNRRFDIPVIDPDALAANGGLSALEAGKRALEMLDAAISGRNSIIVETTLSGRTYHRKIQKARNAGFQTELHYICVDFPDISISRVGDRVMRGGHDIPEEDIIRRFHRSLQNLPSMIRLCHEAVLYNNVADEFVAGYRKLVRFSHAAPDLLADAETLPLWTRQVLLEMGFEI